MIFGAATEKVKTQNSSAAKLRVFAISTNLSKLYFLCRIIQQSNKTGSIAADLTRTSQLKSPPPFNITIWKSLAYNAFSRPFLRWVLEESEKAKALLEWSRDTLTPDEHYWASLNALEEAPGGSGKPKFRGIPPYVQWKTKNICEGTFFQNRCC